MNNENDPTSEENIYSQVQRNRGLWPLQRDMTPFEMAAHQSVMDSILDQPFPPQPNAYDEDKVRTKALSELAKHPDLRDCYRPNSN
jgi:hypothetical protein